MGQRSGFVSIRNFRGRIGDWLADRGLLSKK
jgi:hypothetical protein